MGAKTTALHGLATSLLKRASRRCQGGFAQRTSFSKLSLFILNKLVPTDSFSLNCEMYLEHCLLLLVAKQSTVGLAPKDAQTFSYTFRCNLYACTCFLNNLLFTGFKTSSLRCCWRTEVLELERSRSGGNTGLYGATRLGAGKEGVLLIAFTCLSTTTGFTLRLATVDMCGLAARACTW